MWDKYYSVSKLDEAISIKSKEGAEARIVAGGTDLLLELERGARPGVSSLIDITRVDGLDTISLEADGWIHIGPLVTHNDVVVSKLIQEYGILLSQAAWLVGSPQIRNRGTVAGNLITGSPANDTITPLMALNAEVELSSNKGKRRIKLSEFYTGVRKTTMREDEILTDICFPAMENQQRGIFTKFALRNAQAISLVNIAIILTMHGKDVIDASITLGSVAPTIIHARMAEEWLTGRTLTDDGINYVSELIMEAAQPISDVRASTEYRKVITRVISQRSLQALARDNGNIKNIPSQPVLLATPMKNDNNFTSKYYPSEPIVTTINGRKYSFKTGWNKSLLRLLREEAGLTGSKEGCAEGECGACTVYLDGKAVMSCLVPAPRAHQATITTIEGLAEIGKLHPIQQSFIDEGAVQCGYCTPGLLMSTAKVLEEIHHPTHDQILQSLTGNLCRCTGYYSIIAAVEKAAQNL